MVRNSQIPFLKLSPGSDAIPKPKIKANTSDDITDMIGGTEISKYGCIPLPIASTCHVPLFSTINGKTNSDIIYEKRPEKIVAIYAIDNVISNILPALRFISAIDGATSPIINSGMIKPRNSLKR